MTVGIIALNREQIRDFLDDRLDGSGPCTVSETLPLTVLATTGVVPGARILMAQLADDAGRLTGKGRLNRRLVESLLDRPVWPEGDVEMVRSICKVINEEDFPPAMYLHAILKVAGLARREKGFLKLTRKGKALLPEAAAGRLHVELFRTTFGRYNLAYLDRIDLPELFAPQISLILFLIGQFCTDWRPADALMRSVTMPVYEPTEGGVLRDPTFAFTVRVLRYLCWFGLIEEGRPAANDDWRQPRIFRKTPLYNRALSFTLR